MERFSPYLKARLQKGIHRGISYTRDAVRRLYYQKLGHGIRGEEKPRQVEQVDRELAEKLKIQSAKVEEKENPLGGYNDTQAGFVNNHEHAGQPPKKDFRTSS